MVEFFIGLLVQLLICVVLLWGIGSAVLSLLAPQSYRGDLLLLSPFFGFAVISGVCHYLGVLGFSVGQFAWALLLVGAIALVVVGVHRGASSNLREHWTIIAICLAAYILAIMPLIGLGYLTTVGTSIDAVGYAVGSEYLQEAALVPPDVPAGHPFYGWAASWIGLIRAGDLYFVGVVGALSAARSYQLLTSTAALFFALTPASVYVLSRRTLHLNERPALFAAALAGIHNLLLWAVYDNFLSQTIAVSFFALLLSFAVEAARTVRARETIGFAALFATMLSLYPVYVLPAGAVALFCTFVQMVSIMRCGHQRVLTVVGRYLVWAGMVLALVLMWNGVAVPRALNELGYNAQVLDPERSAVVRGSITVFPPPYEIAGLVAHADVAHSLGALKLPGWILWGFALVIVVSAGFGWTQLPAEGRPAATIAVLMMVSLAVHLRFVVNPPQGYPYGYFKVLSLVLLSLLPLFAQGAYAALGLRRLRHVAWPVLLGVLLLNGISTSWTIRHVLKDRIAVTREVIDVEQGAQSLPLDEWILLDLEPGVTQHWIGYLLRDHRIRYREPLFTYRVYDAVSPSPAYQYALIDRWADVTRAKLVVDEPWYNPETYEVIWSNEVYELRHRTDGVLADLLMSETQGYWGKGDECHIVVDAANGILEAGVGTAQPVAGALRGRPRTLQAMLLVLTPTAEVQIDDVPVALSSGVWTLDIALPGREGVPLENTGSAPVWLRRIKALGSDTGDPASPVEVEQRPEGAALVAQSLRESTLEYQATVLRPIGDDLSTYRLDVHVFVGATFEHFGAWGLDFTGPAPIQHGTLQIDLRTRASQGTLGEADAPVFAIAQDVENGPFEVHVVWWRLDDSSQLSVCHAADFSRDEAGRVEGLRAQDQIPLTIVPTAR